MILIILVALCGPIAQLVEPPAHNRMVRGSNPLGPTTFLWRLDLLFIYKFHDINLRKHLFKTSAFFLLFN